MKKARLFMMLALALPMVAWGQTRTELCNYEGGSKFVLMNGEKDLPYADAQGKSWYEVDYDDSGWTTTANMVYEQVTPESWLCERISFNLAEVKDDVFYYYNKGNFMYQKIWINGVYIGEVRTHEADLVPIPKSVLKTGENILAKIGMYGYEEISFSIFYDNILYERNGQIFEDFEVTDATDITQLSNAVYMDAIESYTEKVIEVQIKLKNVNTIANYQFNLILPFGVRLLEEPTLVNNRHDEHSLSHDGNLNFDRNICFSVFDLTGGELSDNDGAVINLKLYISPYRDAGTFPIKFTNAVFVTPEGTRIGVPPVYVPITVNETEKGDANNNQQITIADVVTIVNHIVGATNDSFSSKGADLNNDGMIDISDAQIALNKVLGRTFTSRQVSLDALDPQ